MANTITAYFRKENAELDANMLRRAQAIKQVQKHCNALQETLSKKEVKTLRHFNRFYSEIEQLSKEYDQRILNLIPDQLLNPEHIPLLIDGLKLRNDSVNIANLSKIDDFVSDGDPSRTQSVYHHRITPHLFCLCRSDNVRLQFLAVSILTQICSLFEPEENDWKIIWNAETETADQMEEKELILPILGLLSHKDSSLRNIAIRFITNYAVTKERRNMLFKNGITIQIVALLDCKSDFKSLSITIKMVKALCRSYEYGLLPYLKYTNEIVKQLNILLFIDDEEILDQVFDCYENLTQRNCSKRFDWETIKSNSVKVNELKSRIKRRAKRDAKYFKKSMKRVERKYDLQIPVVIKEEIMLFAAAFDQKRAKKINGDLGQRVLLLCDKEYRSFIDTNKVLAFIDRVSKVREGYWWQRVLRNRNGALFNEILSSNEHMERMREMLQSRKTEKSAYLLLWSLGRLSNGMKRLIDADFYDLLVNPMKRMFRILIKSNHREDIEIHTEISRCISSDHITADVLQYMIQKGITSVYCNSVIRLMRRTYGDKYCRRSHEALAKLLRADANGDAIKRDLIQTVSEMYFSSSYRKQNVLSQMNDL